MRLMSKNKNQIILASSSPRRKAILQKMRLSFDVWPANIIENIQYGELPSSHCLRLAEEKARVVAKRYFQSAFGRQKRYIWILGADTVVSIDNLILGKPIDIKEAEKMLNLLKGRYHTVVTAFCLLNTFTGYVVKRVVESKVKIKKLMDKEIDDYIKTGEPFDKAGAYAVQGIGGFMVEEIEGSYTNVVGLPVEEFKEVLEKVGIAT